MRRLVMAFVGSVVVGACAKPPPCQRGAWTAPAPCCTKPVGWPGNAGAMQLDAEWVLYDAEAMFDALPAPARAANLAAFHTARDAYVAADQAFVAAARASDLPAAERALARAVRDFMTATSAWSAQTRDRDKYVDARTHADTIERHAPK